MGVEQAHFEGHTPRECGEHRTVGAHRAWCYECTAWCYPRRDMACRGCELAYFRAVVDKVRTIVDEYFYAAHHLGLAPRAGNVIGWIRDALPDSDECPKATS